MDKGTKRKRDSSIPTLVFSAPGYNRFAKLFKETSLDEIKEIVRKRLELSSASDFTLFYDTDIALVNDDDFDAFQVHADSAGHAVDVVVKVLAQTQSTTNVAGSSETAEPTAPDDGARGTSPPRKKRKVAADAPDAPPTAPISSAPRRKKRKGDTMPIEKDSVSSTSVTPEVASKPVETPNDAQQQQPKKKRKNPAAKNLDSTLPNASIPMSGPGDTPGANPVSDPPAPAQERPKKKSKKATEKDAVPKPTAPANVPGSASSTNEIAEPHVDDEDQRKAKTKKAPERGLDNVPPKSSASKKSTKKSKKDIQTEDVPSARNPAHSTAKSVKFAFPDSGFPNQLAQAISTLAGEEGSTPQERQKNPSTEKAKKPSKGKKKVVEQGLEDVDSPELVEPQQAAPDPEAVKEFLKSLVDKLPAAPVPAAEVATDKAAAKATKKLASSSRRDKQTSTTSCPVCQTSPVHLRYRCPIVLAGSGPIRKRIAELQQDDTTDHSQLIQELRGFAEKSQKSSHTKDLQNVTD
ncbi:hypothetical protein C8R44DRAFT_416784 [Mycena epipterygia]|nr:hypothetical protein C8R44DRAFT_416784 [Mycena epipterygia]